MEYFDILDEHFNPTGEIRERTEVHRLGLLHRTVHIWVVKKENGRLYVLLQKRAAHKDSYPGFYDISSAGHMMAGDDYLVSAMRELSEEIGIEAQPEEFIDLGYKRTNHKTKFYGEDFINNEISKVYVYDATGKDLEDFKLQKEEVEEVIWVDYEKVSDDVVTGRLKNCILLDEWVKLRNV